MKLQAIPEPMVAAFSPPSPSEGRGGTGDSGGRQQRYTGSYGGGYSSLSFGGGLEGESDGERSPHLTALHSVMASGATTMLHQSRVNRRCINPCCIEQPNLPPASCTSFR